MREQRRARIILAVLVTATVALAALAHTHAHASRQGPAGPDTSCVFCTHAVAPAPLPVTLPAPVLEESGPRASPAVAPLRVVTVDHPGRDPPVCGPHVLRARAS